MDKSILQAHSIDLFVLPVNCINQKYICFFALSLVMNLLQQVSAGFNQFHLFEKNKKMIIAVSGGIDSVVLCELCKQIGFLFSIAHCNFKLRGEESERDEQFVRSLAAKYGAEVLVKSFDTEKYAAEKKLSIQVAARELRYAWFAQLHAEDKNRYILLAHHTNDDIETLLMNFFRGTGLEGLTGMPEVASDYCIRPLLHITRKEIEDFAAEQGLKWVEDSSNQSSKYTRNFFRNELVPQIKKVFPAVEENLKDNIERFKKINELYKIGVDELKKRIYEVKQSEIVIPIHKLRPYLHTSIIYEIIKDHGFGEKQVDEVLKLLETESGKYIESDSHQIIRHRKNLIIVAKQAKAGTTAIVNEETKQIQLADASFYFQMLPIEEFKLNKSEKVAQLDKEPIGYPLIIRKWKTGDYFYPLGLRKKKKLARFFIDQKLSAADKEKIWVVESGQRIIWVAGLRMDDRFKITPGTKEVLEISMTSL
jgi:tRNA(Ile)-lysidine synthase